MKLRWRVKEVLLVKEERDERGEMSVTPGQSSGREGFGERIWGFGGIKGEGGKKE